MCSSETIELINIILEILSEKIEPERIIKEDVKTALAEDHTNRNGGA